MPQKKYIGHHWTDVFDASLSFYSWEIWGAGGDDYLVGSQLDDIIFGGDGIDTIKAGPGQDKVFGGNDTDYIYGQDGKDELWGNDGCDWVYGGHDNDFISGGAGEDKLVGEHGDDSISGGDDDDVLWGGWGVDYWVDAGADFLYGGKGEDLLLGEHGDDWLFGDDGDDDLRGGPGADHLYGGAGTDTANYEDAPATVFVNLGTGYGTVGFAAGDVLYEIENLRGSQFGDDLRGDSRNNHIEGFEGIDIILGKSGDDTLEGGG